MNGAQFSSTVKPTPEKDPTINLASVYRHFHSHPLFGLYKWCILYEMPNLKQTASQFIFRVLLRGFFLALKYT